MTHDKTRRAGRGQGGFTLMELLVTIVVSVISLAGVLMMQANAVRTNRDSSQFAVATSLAEMVMEQVRGQPVGNLASMRFAPVVEKGTTYSPTVVATDMVESTDLVSIVVRVSFDADETGNPDDPSDDNKRAILQLVRTKQEAM